MKPISKLQPPIIEVPHTLLTQLDKGDGEGALTLINLPEIWYQECI